MNLPQKKITAAISGKKYLILLAIVFLGSGSCSDMKTGRVSLKNGAIIDGSIRVDLCADHYHAKSAPVMSVISDKNRYEISFDEISLLELDGKKYLMINPATITGLHDNLKYAIPAEIMFEGKGRLLKFCSVRYQSTMISSKRYELVHHLIAYNEKYLLLPISAKDLWPVIHNAFPGCITRGELESLADKQGYLASPEFLVLSRGITACLQNEIKIQK